MELSLFTDSVRNLGFEDALDLAAAVGATAVEIAAGGMSSAPHLDLDRVLASDAELDRFLEALASRGLRIGALNCSAWLLHPVTGAQQKDVVLRTFELAERLEVSTVVTMSGCPGDGAGSTTLNWIWYPWPDDAAALRDRQWADALELWDGLAAAADRRGVTRVALELHPLHLTYNVPTLLRLREEIGDVIGMNLDPSHMFWQQMDPIAIARRYGETVYHVHLKDTELVRDEVAYAGVLDHRTFDDPDQRAWNFRTVGVGHGADFWQPFVDELGAAGYEGILSIENEDPYDSPEEGVRGAAEFMLPLLRRTQGAAV